MCALAQAAESGYHVQSSPLLKTLETKTQEQQREWIHTSDSTRESPLNRFPLAMPEPFTVASTLSQRSVTEGSIPLQLALLGGSHANPQASKQMASFPDVKPHAWLWSGPGASGLVPTVQDAEALLMPVSVAEDTKGANSRDAEWSKPQLSISASSGKSLLFRSQAPGTSPDSTVTTANQMEELRREGYIEGAAYSGPEFIPPARSVPLEEPPVFEMENVPLLSLLQTRKPVNAALFALTQQIRQAAVEYCTVNQLNCSEEHALQTAVSVALRTSTVASLLRQISASLSVVEVGFRAGVKNVRWCQLQSLGGGVDCLSTSGLAC